MYSEFQGYNRLIIATNSSISCKRSEKVRFRLSNIGYIYSNLKEVRHFLKNLSQLILEISTNVCHGV